MLNIHRILLALLLPTAASIGLAQTLISWDVSGIEADTLTAPYTVAGTNLATGISGGSLSLGSGTNPTTSAAQYGFKISSSNAQTTLAGAISQNHYMQWTVTADSGFNFTVALFSSVEGFTDGDQIKEVSSIQDVTGGFDSDASGFGSVTFTGMAAYQNISSITFRIYGWNTSNSSSAGTTRIRNLGELDPDLLVLGTATAVPEPFSFAALAGLATIGFAASRRRVRTTMA